MSEISFVIGDKSIKASARRENDSIFVKIGAREFQFSAIAENLFKVSAGAKSHIAAAVKHKDIIYVDIDARVFEVREASSLHDSPAAFSHHAVKDKVFAPMPGKIVKIMVNKGDAVKSKQPLAIVEAMKMENQINSPASGKVKAVNFSVGDQVNTTSSIIDLELESAP